MSLKTKIAFRLFEEFISMIGYVCKLFIDDYAEQKKDEREITIELLEEEDVKDSEEYKEVPVKTKRKKGSSSNAKNSGGRRTKKD